MNLTQMKEAYSTYVFYLLKLTLQWQAVMHSHTESEDSHYWVEGTQLLLQMDKINSGQLYEATKPQELHFSGFIQRWFDHIHALRNTFSAPRTWLQQPWTIWDICPHVISILISHNPKEERIRPISTVKRIYKVGGTGWNSVKDQTGSRTVTIQISFWVSSPREEETQPGETTSHNTR